MEAQRRSLEDREWALWAKRGLDVVLAALGLVLAAPLMACIALAIRLNSPGPVLFVQWRAGKDKRPFRMLKFRTMVDGAEAMLPALLAERGLREPVLKVPDDPRVTRVGRFLRATGLDELPQLWNVLKGEMSLVGPRPEEWRLVPFYGPQHEARFSVRPGLTGPVQVRGPVLSLEERAALELAYVRNWSLWEDLKLLLQTVPKVLRGGNAAASGPPPVVCGPVSQDGDDGRGGVASED
ncbi:MAG: sugar transferase [Anaerolineae bacterium]|nr:sugar transferase [Anaerolineae bacterium]